MINSIRISMVIYCIFFTSILEGTASWKTDDYDKNINELRNELFSRLGPKSKNEKIYEIKGANCWFDILHDIELQRQLRKRILLATDIDETLLKRALMNPLWFAKGDEGNQEIRVGWRLFHQGVDKVVNYLARQDDIDVIAITKRYRGRNREINSHLRENGINLQTETNAIDFHKDDLDELSYLSKVNAYSQNIIFTSSEDKGAYLLEFIKARGIDYDLIVFVDNRGDNCSEVARTLAAELPKKIHIYEFGGHTAKCPHKH